MCGIAGIVRWQGEPLHHGEIERMTEAVNHRGPDGVGFLRRGWINLDRIWIAALLVTSLIVLEPWALIP